MPKKRTVSGQEIDWCLSHPPDGTQGDAPPEGNPLLGFCDECEKSGAARLYLAILEAASDDDAPEVDWG